MPICIHEYYIYKIKKQTAPITSTITITITMSSTNERWFIDLEIGEPKNEFDSSYPMPSRISNPRTSILEIGQVNMNHFIEYLKKNDLECSSNIDMCGDGDLTEVIIKTYDNYKTDEGFLKLTFYPVNPNEDDEFYYQSIRLDKSTHYEPNKNHFDVIFSYLKLDLGKIFTES